MHYVNTVVQFINRQQKWRELYEHLSNFPEGSTVLYKDPEEGE